ncbi:F510_1955 family glycosylhydrolase [Cellulomonas endophytica]|uniref:F510_1955 family glycosylhydrolase n=1 Tax=Cellulomonas endophytica TaxID=2494735 RepID=UPI001F0C5227|nr:exo-alpha-sialidase [Cellulomonas endophytica]
MIAAISSWRRSVLGLGIAGALIVLVGCSGPGVRPATGAAPSETARSGELGAHVHGAGFNPADSTLYVATHEGLLRYTEDGPSRVGPAMDLMGFVVAGPDHFYASGHPGPGQDLPDPVGLLESTDGGRTWTPLARTGASDFHALAVTSTGIHGYDGADLLSSPDGGTTWTSTKPPVPIFAMAGANDGQVLLATSSQGLARATDSGLSWQQDPDAPLLQLVHFTTAQLVVGVGPDGVIYLSRDAGTSWAEAGEAAPAPEALASWLMPDGQVQVVVVADGRVLLSADSGLTFTS